jgi:arylformamidase
LQIFDITRPLRAGMPVWPGDAPCALEWTARIDHGDGCNAAALSLSVHTGTHADGPYHVVDGSARIGDAPLEAFLGPALLLDVAERTVLDEAWAEDVLSRARPARLLVRTGAWTDPDRFPTGFLAPTEGAARRLAGAGLRLFGTDAPSVDPFESTRLDAHRVFCGQGIAILENLLLDLVPAGTYELIALPLRLVDADASPVRAVLRGS